MGMLFFFSLFFFTRVCFGLFAVVSLPLFWFLIMLREYGC
jgi:hypothetical protein